MAAIFCTTWALYNSGNQFTNNKTGNWYDVSNHEYSEILKTLMEAEIELGFNGDIELLVSDFEGFPKGLYSEYISEEVYEIIKKYDQLSEMEKIAFTWLIEERNFDTLDAIAKVEDVGISQESAEDYAENWMEECYDTKSMGFLMRYFDYAQFARDMLMEGSIEEYDGFLITNVQEFK